MKKDYCPAWKNGGVGKPTKCLEDACRWFQNDDCALAGSGCDPSYTEEYLNDLCGGDDEC